MTTLEGVMLVSSTLGVGILLFAMVDTRARLRAIEKFLESQSKGNARR